MIIFNWTTWTYGILLVLLMSCQIFPNISKAEIIVFAWQILYVQYLTTLIQREDLRTAVLVLATSIIVLLSNTWSGIFFLYELILCRWYKLCFDNENAFMAVTIIIFTLILLNIFFIIISILFLFKNVNIKREQTSIVVKRIKNISIPY